LQKFLVGREVEQSPTLLVISQPTWGVDAGAAVAIHEAVVRLAESGTAVVIISQDLDEIMLLCDRIAVIAGGRVSAPIDVKLATVEQIGLLMGGSRAATAEKETSLVQV
jgi:simple sugar transport system ATP-binding protein